MDSVSETLDETACLGERNLQVQLRILRAEGKARIQAKALHLKVWRYVPALSGGWMWTGTSMKTIQSQSKGSVLIGSLLNNGQMV